MTTDPGYMKTGTSAHQSVNYWSRFLGVSLRPWSGQNPLILIISGVIQVVLFSVITVFILGMRSELDSSLGEYAEFGTFLLLLGIVFAGIVLLALLRIIVGVIDLVPRIQVQGVVESVSDRRVGDFLPQMFQRMLFNRISNNGLDKRQTRTELVLRTDKGHRQWTVRSRKARKKLRVGEMVTISASPLMGYVSNVETS